jgi:hypothetical protein
VIAVSLTLRALALLCMQADAADRPLQRGKGRVPVTLTNTEIVLLVVVAVLAAIALWLWMRGRRTAALKDRFGPEYERTVHETGDERKAETILEKRERRVSSYTIKPLPAEMHAQFVATWRQVQAQFVDDPKYAVTRADDLLGEVMRARGYPVSDFEHRAEDLSVDHPEVVQNYRTAHHIALRHSRGEASTEDMRTAMIHYRALFDDLVNEPDPRAKPLPKEKSRG